jgi:hypothetical protein
MMVVSKRFFEFLMRRVAFIPIAFAGLIFVAAFFSGIASGVYGTATHMLISLTGMTAVLSSEEHGLTGHPYSGYRSIQDALEGAAMTPKDSILEKVRITYPENYYDDILLNAAIRATSGTETCGSALVYHGGNDQGLIDYIRISFWLFGHNTYSLYYFYFVVLLLTSIAYLAVFWRSYMACVLLFAAVCAVYPFLATYLHADEELITVATPRYLGTLGMVPLLHLSLQMAVVRARLTWGALAALIVQSAVITLVLTIRSSEIWMVVGIVLLTLYYVFARLWAGVLRSQALIALLAERGLVLLVFVATFLSLGVGLNARLPSSDTALNSHTIWHNVFAGLRFSPEWKERFAALYDNMEDDALAFTAAKKYVQQHRLPYTTEPDIWVASRADGDEPSIQMPFGSWKAYDDILRSAFFEFAREHPRYVIENFLYYKPLMLARTMGRFFKTIWHDMAGWKLFVLVLMIAVLAAFATRTPDAPTEERSSVGQLLIMILPLLVLSTVPTLLAYGLSFLIVDTAFLLIVMIVLAAFGAFLVFFRRFEYLVPLRPYA